MCEADLVTLIVERDVVQLWLGPTRRCGVSSRRHAPQMGRVPPIEEGYQVCRAYLVTRNRSEWHG
jgi:hypothetical protein